MIPLFFWLDILFIVESTNGFSGLQPRQGVRARYVDPTMQVAPRLAAACIAVDAYW